MIKERRLLLEFAGDFRRNVVDSVEKDINDMSATVFSHQQLTTVRRRRNVYVHSRQIYPAVRGDSDHHHHYHHHHIDILEVVRRS